MSAVSRTLVSTRRALVLLWSVSRLRTVLWALITGVDALLPALIAVVAKLIVDSVVAGDVSATLTWVGAEAGLVVLRSALYHADDFLRTQMGARLSIAVYERVVDKALSVRLQHFEDPEFSDLLARAAKEAGSRPLHLAQHGLEGVRSTVSLISYAVILLTFGWWVVLALVVGTLPQFFAQARYAARMFRVIYERTLDERRAQYLKEALTTEAFAKEIKLFAAGRWLLQRFIGLQWRFYHQDQEVIRRELVLTFVARLLASLVFYALYAVVAWEAVHGRITLGDMTMYMMAVRGGQTTLEALLNALSKVYEDNLYMENLFAFLAHPSDEPDAPGPVDASQGPARVSLEGVGFSYPGTTRPVLEDISLEIQPGETLALVGPNGAGKTTLVKLVARLYEVTDGRVLLDGEDVRELDPAWLRARIGVIFQDFVRWHLSLAENVGMGWLPSLEDEPALEAAAEQAGAAAIVERLGWQMPMGRYYGGEQLSMGQWQRIALARAFARPADLLILDEPTASLDPESEARLFERMVELKQGRTAILVTHRFSTVRFADRIAVLEGGHLVELGTHAELMAREGLYARMFETQAAGYRISEEEAGQ